MARKKHTAEKVVNQGLKRLARNCTNGKGRASDQEN